MSGFLCRVRAVASRPKIAEAGRALHAPHRRNTVRHVSAGEAEIYAVNTAATTAFVESADAAVFLFGVIYHDATSAGQNTLEAILARFEREGAPSLFRLSGSFVLLALDKRNGCVTLLNDPIGSIPVYWRRDVDGGLSAATECKPLLLLGDRPPYRLPPLLNSLLFGRVKFSREPFFDTIHCLPPGSALSCTPNGGVRLQTYYRFAPQPGYASRSAEEWVEEAATALRQMVADRLDDSDLTALLLTGGIDSRLLAAAVPDRSFRSTLAVSFGMRGNAESMLAGRVADYLGLAHLDLVLTPTHFLDYAESGVEVAEGQDLFVQGYLSFVAERLRCDHGVDAVLDGMDVGVSLGGEYLRPEFRALPRDRLAPYLFERWYLHRAPPEEVFHDDARAVGMRLIEEALDQAAHLRSPYDVLDWFYLEHYAREAMRLRHRVLRRHLRVLPIIPDARYLQLTSLIPGPVKEGRRFELQVLERLQPGLLDIAYHSTMVPLRAPRSVWDAGRRRLDDQERWCQEQWRDHRVVAPFGHYFTNFAEWLRSDRNLLQFQGDLLLGRDCRVTRGLVRADWVERTLSEHWDGSHDHRASILHLLTAELFLRRFGEP